VNNKIPKADYYININLTDDVTFEYFARVGYHDDEISILLKGHLLVEHLLNKIIKAKCKNPEKILNDHRSYPFTVKLQIVYSMGLLPEYLFKNVTKLNAIRNRLVHDLNFHKKEIDMRIFNSLGENILLKTKGKKNPRKFYLKMLSHAALSQLRNHLALDTGISPKVDRSVSIFG